MQDQLTGGQSNLQQQTGSLQQSQSNVQQNTGGTSTSSNVTSLLNDQPTTTQLQVQSQGQSSGIIEQPNVVDGGLSSWWLLLLFVPVLLVLAILSARSSQPSAELIAEPEPEPKVVEKPAKTPKPKPKKKQTRRKRASKA